MKIGCHLSIAKGFPSAYKMAEAIEATTFQFFSRNPRGSRIRQIELPEKNEWLELLASGTLRPIVAHLPYTVNAASPEIKKRDFARHIILADLNRMNELQVDYLVMHPGNFTSGTRASGLKMIINTLSYVFEHYQGDTILCLETMSGKGTELGRTIQELAMIINTLNVPHLGVCLDSCHLFAAGYDFVQSSHVQRLVADIHHHIGFDNVKLSHLNDSLEDCGSHKDRHARLTQGKLGQKGLLNYLNHPQIAKLPLILETPVEKPENYRMEIKTALDLIT